MTTTCSDPLEPAVLEQPPHAGEARGSFRTQQKPFVSGEVAQLHENLGVVNGDGISVAAVDRVQDQLVSEWVRDGDAERYGATPCTHGCARRSPAAKARTIGAQPVACTATSRGRASSASQPEGPQFGHSLVDSDQTDPTPGWIDDDVGSPPA